MDNEKCLMNVLVDRQAVNRLKVALQVNEILIGELTKAMCGEEKAESMDFTPGLSVSIAISLYEVETQKENARIREMQKHLNEEYATA